MKEAHISKKKQRQFISEFGSHEMPVYLLNTNGEYKVVTVAELLPFAFGLEHLENAKK